MKLVSIIIVLAALTAGCNMADQQSDSAREIQRGETVGDLEPAVVVEPDSVSIFLSVEGFRNVQRMCVQGNGIYVTSRGGVTVNSDGTVSGSSSGGSLPSGIDVVEGDPTCPGR